MGDKEVLESAGNDAGQVEAKPAKEKPRKKGGIFKRFKHAVMFFVLGAVIGSAGVVALQVNGTLAALGIMKGEVSVVTTIDGKILKEQVEEIGELASISYDYSAVVEQTSKNQIPGTSFDLPLTTKQFLLTYDGKIKAGVDMEKADVSVNGYDVEIVLPHAQILSHEIDEDSVQYYDLKNDLFNKIGWEDRKQARKYLKQEQEKKVAESDLLGRADAQACSMLEAFCKSMLPEDYSVTVKTAEETNDDEQK